MTGLKIVFSIIFILLYFVMVSIMILFERKKPRIVIIWIAIFLLTQIFGYIAYLIVRCIMVKKKNSLLIKEQEDEIYSKLVSKNIKDFKIESVDHLFSFNEMLYSATTTNNNDIEIFNSFTKFKDNLIKEIKASTSYIFLELSNCDFNDFKDINPLLINKAKEDVAIRLTLDCHIPRKFKKELKSAGVKIYKFNKINSVYNIYSNQRNIISIDNNVIYLGKFLNKKYKNVKNPIEYVNSYLKIKGDAVQKIDLTLRQDLAFSSGKYIEYTTPASNKVENNLTIQYIPNTINLDLELLLIKAICTAQKSIQLQVNNFIPTDSIISLLKYATNSNLQVRLMIPIKDYNQSRKFASRAFAKELALLGANVYLYDGYINHNAIVLDNEYIVLGSYSLNRNFVNSSLQSVLLIKDEKVISHYNKAFDDAVKNSYRVNNAKYMLIREKLFKNIY